MNKNTIVVIGANGQLGTDLLQTFSSDQNIQTVPLLHKDIEITNLDNIQDVLGKINPDIVINTAAYNKVDDSEKEPDSAYQINSLGPRNLATYCGEKNITLVHFSTDYVFGLDSTRTTPYTENDAPGPLNVYGVSKLAGEYFVRAHCPKHLVVRTSGLYGKASSSGKGYNFVNIMLKLAKEKGEIKVVNDQIMTPTSTLSLSRQIHKLLGSHEYGLYHASADGECSWYEFAQEIFALTNIHTQLIPISSGEYAGKAKRGKYSVLENAHLKDLGIHTMKHWKEELKEYLS